MSLVAVLVALVVVGVCLWLVETYLPMDPAVKRIVQVVAILALVIWLLRWAGFV